MRDARVRRRMRARARRGRARASGGVRAVSHVRRRVSRGVRAARGGVHEPRGRARGPERVQAEGLRVVVSTDVGGVQGRRGREGAREGFVTNARVARCRTDAIESRVRISRAARARAWDRRS